MINFRSKIALSTLVSLLFISTHANAAGTNEEQAVAKVIGQKNQVIAEDRDGVRRLLAKDSEIFDGEHLLILENASVELHYLSSACKIVHGANTLLTVDAASQCAVGQQMAVGQGAAAGSASKIGSIGSSLGIGAGAVTSLAIGTVIVGGIVTVAATNDGPASN